MCAMQRQTTIHVQLSPVMSGSTANGHAWISTAVGQFARRTRGWGTALSQSEISPGGILTCMNMQGRSRRSRTLNWKQRSPVFLQGVSLGRCCRLSLDRSQQEPICVCSRLDLLSCVSVVARLKFEHDAIKPASEGVINTTRLRTRAAMRRRRTSPSVGSAFGRSSGRPKLGGVRGVIRAWRALHCPGDCTESATFGGLMRKPVKTQELGRPGKDDR
jgi:hypothetical protein